MSKPHKIKRYSDKSNLFSKKKKTRFLKPILSILVLGLFVFIGISAYNPIKDYVTGNTQPNPLPDTPSIVDTQLTPAEPEPPAIISDIVEDIPSKNENIKAMIMPIEVAQNSSDIDAFLDTLPENINTIVITAKNELGQVLYNTSVATATKWEAVTEKPINIGELKQKLEKKDLSLAVRLSVFSDPIAARADLENNAIMHSSGVIWIDNTLANGGKPWATPYSTQVRDYNIQLIKELSNMGAELIICDYLRFPNDPTNSAQVKPVEGVSRKTILETFYNEAESAVGENPTRISASIGLWAASQKGGGVNSTLYGGDPMTLSIQEWTLSIDDYLIDNGEVTDFVGNHADKTLVYLTERAINYDNLASTEDEFILY